MVNKIKEFLRRNPPEKIPFWPGARVTEPFGLRSSQASMDEGASPIHLGPDRAYGNTPNLIMPFNGTAEWRRTNKVTGSLLRIIPHELDMELHVFHTEMNGMKAGVAYSFAQGDGLPFQPSNLGLSLGVHTHTEAVFPWSEELVHYLEEKCQPIVSAGRINDNYLVYHCSRYSREGNLLHPERMRLAMERQIASWGIRELWTEFAVRQSLPQYRRPEWGGGPTIHVNSIWMFKI